MGLFDGLFGSKPATQKTNPWEPAQGALRDVLAQAGNLFQSDPTGQNVLSNPLVQQSNQALGDLTNFDFGALTDLTRSQVLPQLNSQFSASGRSGSGAHQGAVAQGLSRGLAQNMLQANQQRLGAAGLSNQIGTQQGLLPQQLLGNYANIAQGIGGLGGSTTQRAASSSPFQQAAGIGLGLAGLFSDERVKKDIKKVGKTDGGLGVFTYKYKGDPSKVTHMGVMAQEAAKKTPSAVFKSTMGPLAVDYSQVA